MSRQVVITGIGLVTPIGLSVSEFWEACQQGVSGVDRITAFDPSDYSTQIAAELKDFDPSTYLSSEILENGEMVHQMGLIAAMQAVEDSGLDVNVIDRWRLAICAGSGLGTRIVSEERISAIYHYEQGVKDIPPAENLYFG